MRKLKGQKILVAMSGGVDSSVAVALLKKDGFSPTGVFFRLFDGSTRMQKDIRDVKKVGKILDISVKIIDAMSRFEKKVIRYFLKEYQLGRTPNPCVFCNKNFKFALLLEEADKMGIRYVATGHYARLRESKAKSEKLKIKEKSFYKLFVAKDEEKDQSYFLYRLGQKELSRIVFPLGELKKREVKKMAQKLGLPVVNKSESQDVCFLAGKTTENFLKKNIKLKRGKIIDTKKNILGEHEGLPLFTIGQRKGIGIGGKNPFYVIGKNSPQNSLVVGTIQQELSSRAKNATLEDVSWILGASHLPGKLWVRNRYHDPLIRAQVSLSEDKNNVRVEFEKPQRAITPGQSTVFYGKGGEVIGGGIIK